MTIKDSLIKMALGQRRARLQNIAEHQEERISSSLDKFCHFENYTAYQAILQKQRFSKKFKINNPFFIQHDGIAAATSVINGAEFINFSSYNFLNLNGDHRVSQAAKDAIDRYGTSASASRLVAGERPIHAQLETALAKLHNVDNALVFVSGHATNVTTIGYLFSPKDLIIHDELIHDSVLQGIKLSGALRLSFPHNNWQFLDELLTARRAQFERVLIIIEGLYSMDGDYPDLPQFIAIKNRHKTFLMVDEAHSIGILGSSGRGIADFFAIDGKEVDIWMGTLSKTLVGCGGYIAGNHALIEHLKFAVPGFLYSVGMAPPLAAAAFTALKIMLAEPERVAMLNLRATQFLTAARVAGLNTCSSAGLGIIPIIYGASKKAIQISNSLHKKNINVQTIIYPAIPDNQARLRFFINSEHTLEQINYTIA